MLLDAAPWPSGQPLRLRGADVIGGDWHVLPGDGTALVNPAAHKFEALRRRKGRRDDPLANFHPPGCAATLAEPALLLGGHTNFYHALADYLINWSFAEGLADGRRIIVSAEPSDIELDIMAFMGVSTDRLFRARSATLLHCDDLMVLPRAVRGIGHVVDHRPIEWLRGLSRRQVSGRGSPAKRLYVSRALAARRAVGNEAELAARLTSLGFHCVTPETLPFADQVALFADAAIVVGPHGAGLTNMLAMAPGSTVIEIKPIDGSSGRYFLRIAGGIGLRFERVDAGELVMHGGDAHPSSSFHIDVEAVVSAAQRAIAALP